MPHIVSGAHRLHKNRGRQHVCIYLTSTVQLLNKHQAQQGACHEPGPAPLRYFAFWCWVILVSKRKTRASLVVQWLRICLPMQGTRVRALVWEDPTCRGATRPVSHSYWACAYGACAPNKRGRDSERPAHRDEGWPLLAATRESPCAETKTQHSQK